MWALDVERHKVGEGGNEIMFLDEINMSIW